MSDLSPEPGLGQHDWTTQYEQLRPSLEDEPEEALPELAALPGCFLFEKDAELRRLLEAFRDGQLAVPHPEEMHDAVAERYGLVAFGLAYLEHLKVVAR